MEPVTKPLCHCAGTLQPKLEGDKTQLYSMELCSRGCTVNDAPGAVPAVLPLSHLQGKKEMKTPATCPGQTQGTASLPCLWLPHEEGTHPAAPGPKAVLTEQRALCTLLGC